MKYFFWIAVRWRWRAGDKAPGVTNIVFQDAIRGQLGWRTGVAPLNSNIVTGTGTLSTISR
jgi:hypothetical protein